MIADLRTPQDTARKRWFHPKVKPHIPCRALIVSIIILPLAVQGVFLARAAPTNRTLVVHGYSGQLAVVEIGGRFYVEIEALAHLSNGSLTIQGDRLILTMPAPSESVSVAASPAPQPAVSGFSKDFLKAGIEGMSVIREWRGALTGAVQRGFPITGEWLNTYSGRARQSLAMMSLAISTDSDRKAFQLLTNVFNNMQQLSDRFAQANKSMTYVAPDALNNDPLDQRILKCERALASMAASNQFMDEASCH